MVKLFGIQIRKKVVQQPTAEQHQQSGEKSHSKLKMIFVQKLSKLDRKASKQQRTIALLLFCSTMLSIFIFNLWWQMSETNIPPVLDPQTIILPRDVAIPDSLDVNQTKINRQWLQQLSDSIIKK